MLWKILLVLITAISILLYLVILGANKSKTIEEREEDYLQMVDVIKKQKGKEDEKTNNCRETECCKRINEMFEKMYKN